MRDTYIHLDLMLVKSPYHILHGAHHGRADTVDIIRLGITKVSQLVHQLKTTNKQTIITHKHNNK